MNDLIDKLAAVTPGILTATSHRLAGFIRYPEQCQALGLGCPGGTPLVNKTCPF